MDQLSNSNNYREQESRRVSSVILQEEILERIPEDTVRYVEVPQIQEVIKHVTKVEIVEVEKRVPKYNVQYVEREVIIPNVTYVDKHVEVPQIQEIVRHVPIKQVVDVPKEVIKTVPRIETKIVEQFVDVPGPVIEVPKPYTVENKVTVPVYADQHEAVVVAQTLQPVITETNEEVEVEVMEYEPEIIPVEVQVPKAVAAQLIAKGIVEEFHRVVDVPAAHFNSLLRVLNPHVADAQFNVLPWVREGAEVPFLDAAEKLLYTTPLPGVEIRGIENTPLGFRGSYNTGRNTIGNSAPISGYSAQPQDTPQLHYPIFQQAQQPQYQAPQYQQPQTPQYQQPQYPLDNTQQQYGQAPRDFYPPTQGYNNSPQYEQAPTPQGYNNGPYDQAPAPQGYGASPAGFDGAASHGYEQPRALSSRQPSAAPGYSQRPSAVSRSGAPAASGTRSRPAASRASRAPETDLSKLKASAAQKKKTGCC